MKKEREVKRLLRGGERVPAIRLLREHNPLSLLDAYSIVERWWPTARVRQRNRRLV